MNNYILTFGNQEIFWRIPAKISSSQLRSAAAALHPREEEEQPEGGEEPQGAGSPTGEPQEEEPPSGEQRTQALRALLLARKRKQDPTQHTGSVEPRLR